MIHHFMKCTISLLVMWLMLLTSCNSSKEVLYFQDLKSGNSVALFFCRLDEAVCHRKTVSVFAGTARNYNYFLAHNDPP